MQKIKEHVILWNYQVKSSWRVKRISWIILHTSLTREIAKSVILSTEVKLPFSIVEVIVAQLHAHQIMCEHVKTV